MKRHSGHNCAGSVASAAAVCVAALLALALVACDHAERFSLEPVDRGLPDQVQPLPAALQATALRAHPDYDRLEVELEAHGGLSRLLPVYEALMAERPDDTLLRVRTVLLLIRAGGQGRIQKAIPQVESLRQTAPDDPNVLFALGAIKRIVLFDPVSETFFVTNEQVDIARRLLEDWQKLLTIAPEFQGPHGEDAASLTRQVAALQLLLDVPPMDAPATGATGATAQGESPDTRRSPDELEALGKVLRFLEARERLKADAACKAGRAAIEAGGASVYGGLSEVVDEVCGRVDQ